MDRLDAMTVFLAVVESGSLSAASRHLRTPLATVSRKVAELEAHLRVQLITRTNRRIALTEAGRGYVDAARDILARVHEAEQIVAGEYAAPRGDLTITAPIVFGRLHVLPIVTDFLKIYPEINIRLTLSDHLVDLLDEPVDIAVRIGNLPDSDLVAARVGMIRRVVYASPGYLSLRGTPAHPSDLKDHDCVTFEGMTSPTSWIFQAGKREIAVPVRTRLTVNTAEAAVDAATADLGITRVLSYQAAKAVAEGRLVELLGPFEHPASSVQLVHIRQGFVPQKFKAFMDFAMPRLRSVLG